MMLKQEPNKPVPIERKKKMQLESDSEMDQ
jgi:hypothetical protein